MDPGTKDQGPGDPCKGNTELCNMDSLYNIALQEAILHCVSYRLLTLYFCLKSLTYMLI